MGSLSFGEILTIAIVVLVVFGPRRLPDLARRAGALVAKARETLASVTEAMQKEYGDAAQPFTDLKEDVSATGRELRDAVSTLGEAIESTGDGEDAVGGNSSERESAEIGAPEGETGTGTEPAATAPNEDGTGSETGGEGEVGEDR